MARTRLNPEQIDTLSRSQLGDNKNINGNPTQLRMDQIDFDKYTPHEVYKLLRKIFISKRVVNSNP